MLKTFEQDLFSLPTKSSSPQTSPRFMYIFQKVFFQLYTNIFTFVYRHKKDPDKVLRRKTFEHTIICSKERFSTPWMKKKDPLLHFYTFHIGLLLHNNIHRTVPFIDTELRAMKDHREVDSFSF